MIDSALIKSPLNCCYRQCHPRRKRRKRGALGESHPRPDATLSLSPDLFFSSRPLFPLFLLSSHHHAHSHPSTTTTTLSTPSIFLYRFNRDHGYIDLIAFQLYCLGIVVEIRLFLLPPLHPTVISLHPPPNMTTTLERSLSRNSNMSIPLSSPRFSIQDDSTTPEVTDPDLSRVYSRLNGIDSNVLDIRSSVITKDSYVDRRNREDQHIRREFDAHRAIYTRIDVNVVAIRSDVDQLKSEIFQVKSSIRQSGTDTALLRSDLDHLQKKVDQIQEDLDSIRSSVSGSYVETTRLKASVYQLRTEMLTLHNETSRQLRAIESRMDNFENRMGNFETRMRLSDRVRFNSLAHATYAPITPVPMIDADGTFRFPGYFPKTVWRFWCLKKRSRGK